MSVSQKIETPPVIASRYHANIEVMASIIGSTEDQKFVSVDASLTDLAIKALDQELPFNIGTIIEIRIPLFLDDSKKPETLELMGKVVRVQTDEKNAGNGKVLCGVHLINMNTRESLIWEKAIKSFKQSVKERNTRENENYAHILNLSA